LPFIEGKHLWGSVNAASTLNIIMNTYIPPALGTVKAFIVPWENCTVQVQVFKFDTIRQQAYWVTKQVKSFKTTQQALAYIDRITRDRP
jgi:hypothetical protein